ncbi:MAG: motility associated factor glycosyltransferase family protein, partial [Spirochaetaceae bacterium]|nr:motility associated factor glycosyltransferase family protein [Spirochaetaceae bacterium]
GLNPDFNPLVIIVTEPALSYCLKPLKIKFPKAKIGAIRFVNDFNEYNSGWDFVIGIKDIPSLLTKLGEDLLLSTLFISWAPSSKAFSQEYEFTWKEIKKLLKTSQDILATRTYFSNRWIKNTLRFCVYAKNNYILTKGNAPVLIAASGPSLKKSLPEIKKYRNKFFLIALSSAYEVLRENDIIPDICISTDGGFWAKRHIKNCSVPLIVSAESAIAWQNTSLPVIPIKYGDSPEAILLDICGFKTLNGRRNGTVSGTAVELALSLTSSDIYACGLDLACSKGFQHTQPNALENDKIPMDFRLKNKETRIYPGEKANGSLNIYREWFSMQNGDFAKRLKRLTTKDCLYESSLGNIETITWDKINFESSTEQIKKPEIIKNDIPSHKERINTIKKLFSNFEQNCISKEWLSSLLPADFITYKRSLNEEEGLKEIKVKLSEKIDSLADFLYKLEKSL